MEGVDIQGTVYPGFGRCIYCGSDGGTEGLRDEHIMPFCLGGNAIIEKASCKACEAITSYLDGYMGRRVFYELRVHSGSAKLETRKIDQRTSMQLCKLPVS